jgi:drug/metabolite transporter (DMT)-like permease
MGTLLALAAALTYGTSHFLGGLVSRRASLAWVAALGQLAGLIVVGAAAPFFQDAFFSGPGLGWGALSGVGTGAGVVFLYRGFATGNMSVVSPLSEVAAVVLPALVGLGLGERPSTLALSGLAMALPAIGLVSRGADTRAQTQDKRGSGKKTSGALAGVLAGAGFALQFIGLGQVPIYTGLWPLVAGRVASVAILGIRAFIMAEDWPRMSLSNNGLTAAAGAIGTTGSLLYMLATRQQLLALAAALASLYPIIPVLAGRFVLKERISYTQMTGLGCAAVAIALIACG